MSTLLGRFFRCTQMPQRGKPNVWMIMSSIPGRMRRSTIQYYTDYVYKRTMMNYFDTTHKMPRFGEWDEGDEGYTRGKGKKGGKKKAQFTEAQKAEITRIYRDELLNNGMIEEGTPEGIMDKIEAANQREFTIVSTEIGSVLKRMGSRDYQIGVSTLLSKLYYGEGGSIALSRRSGKGGGRAIPPGLYVTMFAGMQEPKWYLDMSMVRQGLLRRIMILYVEPGDLNRWLPPIVDGRDEIYGELKDFSDKILDLMVEYKNTASAYSPPFMDIQFNPRVTEEVNLKAKVLDEELKQNPTNANIYNQSIWEHLAKLAMLRRIGEGKLESLGGYNQVTVREDNLKVAERFIEPVVDKAAEIILSIGEEPQPIRTYEEPLERVFRIIALGGKGGTKRSEVYRRSGMVSNELDQLISTLIRQGRIEKAERHTKGRPAIIYRPIFDEL